MLNWQQTEFLLKGVYLGLLVMIALVTPPPRPDELAYIGLCTLACLSLFIGVAAVRKIREGHHINGHWLPFLIFLMLETPYTVYAGILIGLSAGTWLTFTLTRGDDAVPPEALWAILGGAVLGGVFYGMRHVRERRYRFWMGAGLIAACAGGAAGLFYLNPGLHDPRIIGTLLLLGIPGFYLLTFAGHVEESEIEIAALCAALGFGLWTFVSALSPIAGGGVLLLPLVLFLVYTRFLMPELRVFKHALRGMSYRQLGQMKPALVSLGRALQLDPGNTLARHQLWDLHRNLNFVELKQQPDLLAFLNFEFCLERISQVLQTRPKPEELIEARRMLDWIAAERPALAPVCAYWRAVAFLHDQQHAEAAAELDSILKLPQASSAARQSVHFQTWQLAMHGHPEMARRVADVLLPLPGQRMDAIAAVETQLRLTPQDQTAWDMKRQLYADLSEAEYWSTAAPGQPPALFNHEYAQQLGLALLDNPQEWQRGCQYLHIAANGLPQQTASIYIQIAQTHEKHGDLAGMWAHYQKAMQFGRSVGVQNLAAAEKESLFAAVKKIGDAALADNQLDTALEAYKFYSLNETAGIETYRMLAELFERKAAAGPVPARANELWQALHCTEHALSYNSADADLIARKDRYYYSIMPDELQARLESVRSWFDPQYCRDKARWILERQAGDFELLDWGEHLIELALVAQPGSHAARLLKARIKRTRGEIPETIAILEEIRQHRPERFANTEEEKAWYYAHRLLGDLYIDDKPDQAALCFEEFRLCDESGADTSFKLGRAYEAMGKLKEAYKYYEAVTVYEQHPLFFDARDALDRLKRAAKARVT